MLQQLLNRNSIQTLKEIKHEESGIMKNIKHCYTILNKLINYNA